MARPVSRPDSKYPQARKVVPVGVRHILGRTEFKRAIRASTQAEFCKLWGEAMAEFEAQIEAARDQLEGRLRTLTLREADDLAEEWYRGRVEALGGDANTADHWELERDLLSSLFLPQVDPEGEPIRHQRRTFAPDAGTLRAARLRLLERGIAADEQSVRVFAERWAMARWRLMERMERRLEGNWSDEPPNDEPRPTALHSAPVGPAADPTPAVAPLTWMTLLDRWSADRQRAQNTVKAYGATLRQLKRVLGFDDPRKMDPAAVLLFKEARRAEGVSAKTIYTDIQAAGAVFQWGVRHGLVRENPFARTTETPDASAERPVRPYRPDEARRILEAARQEGTGWRRWLPWLLCFTGARISDIATLRRRDVEQTEGVWEIRLAPPDWRKGKTRNAPRRLPMHRALIAEGFLDYLTSVPADGLLFPELGAAADESRTPDHIARLAQNAHARWVRSKVGIEHDEEAAQHTAPAHSWRHLLKDGMEAAGLPENFQDAILGHTNARNAGAGYGTGLRNRPDVLAPELDKVPSPIPPLEQPGDPTT